MKKIIMYAVAVALMFTANVIKAQDKLKEGKLTFEISYPDAEEMSDQMLAMMPKELTTYFKDHWSRSELTMGYGTVITIYNPEKKESYTCMDMMGRKSAIKKTDEDIKKEKDVMGDYEVKLSDDTKKIAGYTCKKATVTMKNDGTSFDVWYTPDLPYDQDGRYGWKGIEGCPMEFTMDQKTQGGTLKMKFSCTKVEKATVADDKFSIPEGYTVMTADEAKKQFSGGH